MGIAKGAAVTLDQVWCANMLNELENLKRVGIQDLSATHCSDIYAISTDGYNSGFAHGHNDDWSQAAKEWWYFTSYTYPNGNVPSCAGVTYPATLVGWAPSWNEHGIFATQNSMLPRTSRAGGLAAAFVQRRAILSAHNLDTAISALTVPGWSDGASMNIVDLHQKRMANVELWEDLHSFVEITAVMGNYSHFNEYKHLKQSTGKFVDNPGGFVNDPRQRRSDMLPPPRSEQDVMDRLSDAQIFRSTRTLTTLVVNGSTGRLNIWCGTPSTASAPVYSFSLFHFFENHRAALKKHHLQV